MIAIPNIQRLLEACRTAEIPVVFITPDVPTRQYLKMITGTKTAKDSFERDRELAMKENEIPQEIAPLPTELVIGKIK
ncbi:MAG: isochorismatase family protein, partial [Proteobacteria bacterium]|nr:isochorismatase family protein [Pseudomonadota bacterium]